MPPREAEAQHRGRASREGVAARPRAGHEAPGVASANFDVVYGRNPVIEALRGRRRVHTVLLAAATPDQALEAALSAATSKPVVKRLSAHDLAELTGSPDHQDIAALVDPYSYADPDRLLAEHSLVIALDEIQDPHNLGAVIRTAEAAGAGVIIPRHRAAQVTATVVKTSAGATEHAAIAMVRNLADFLQTAKEKGFWVYGAAAAASSRYTSQDYTYPTIFVVGSEGQGLGKRVGSLCDSMVSLPLSGAVSSLNASVSAAILLYEAVRQRDEKARGGVGGFLPPGTNEKETP